MYEMIVTCSRSTVISSNRLNWMLSVTLARLSGEKSLYGGLQRVENKRYSLKDTKTVKVYTYVSDNHYQTNKVSKRERLFELSQVGLKPTTLCTLDRCSTN